MKTLALLVLALATAAATTTNITIEQGSTWTKAWKTNRVLTGCTLGMEVRDVPGGTLFAAPSYTITSATRGEFTTTLTAAQTEALGFSGTAVYDIEAACAGDVTYRLFEGDALLTRQVTVGEVAPGEWPEPADPPGSVYLRIDDAASTYYPIRVFDVKLYGAAGDGIADDSVAVQAAIDAAMGSDGTGTGGVIYFPPGTYRINSKISLRYNGGGPGVSPTQPNVRFQGAGAEFSGQSKAPIGGSILDLRYSGTPAKLDTRGLGALEITGLTFASLGGSDTTPFIQTTNTTLLVHHCGFYGNTNHPGNQDAILLGGDTAGLVTINTDETETSAFQGYGTVIDSNYFNRIRRAIWGRGWTNAVVLNNNTVWSESGFTTGAAIDLDGGSGGFGQVAGNVISNNLIEMNGYAYGIRLGYAYGNSLSHNNFYDPGASSVAFYHLDVGSHENLIIDGFHITSLDTVDDDSGESTWSSQIIPMMSGQDWQIGNASGKITYSASDHRYTGTAVKLGHYIGSNGAEYYNTISGTAANPEALLYLKPNGGTADAYVRFHYYGTDSAGVSAGFFENRDGDVKIRAKGGNTTWLGDINGTHLYYQESTKTLVLNDASGRLNFGGVTSSNVGLKASGTLLRARLGDDSADADFAVKAVVAASPSISTVCSSSTRGAIAYVDDTDDGAISHLCFCGTAADDSTYGWRRADAPASACP